MDLGMERRNVKPATIGSLVLVLRVATGGNCSERTGRDGRRKTVGGALNFLGWLLQGTSSLGAPNQNFVLVTITRYHERLEIGLRTPQKGSPSLQTPVAHSLRPKAKDTP